MIITQLDSTYARWLDLFLSSLKRTNPHVKVSVELVNFPPVLAVYFESKYPQAEFVPISLDGPSRHIMAHRKVDAALNVLERHPSEPWYIVCDVDLLFRDSLDVLINELMNHDAGVVFRDGLWDGQYYEYLRVACGFVAYKDARLMCAWKREMEKPACRGLESSSWFYDQMTLLNATEQVPLSYLAIDDSVYINRDFSDSAVVWSANWEPKELMYLKFVDEHYRLELPEPTREMHREPRTLSQ
jgi:hypothetical protein